jgi:hypothetical protein
MLAFHRAAENEMRQKTLQILKEEIKLAIGLPAELFGRLDALRNAFGGQKKFHYSKTPGGQRRPLLLKIQRLWRMER